MIGLAEPPYSRADEPEERGGIFGVVEEVGEVEGQEGEVVGGVDAGIDFPQEPFVVVEYPLPETGIVGQLISPVVARPQYRSLRGVDLIALVELPLQIR